MNILLVSNAAVANKAVPTIEQKKSDNKANSKKSGENKENKDGESDKTNKSDAKKEFSKEKLGLMALGTTTIIVGGYLIYDKVIKKDAAPTTTTEVVKAGEGSEAMKKENDAQKATIEELQKDKIDRENSAEAKVQEGIAKGLESHKDIGFNKDGIIYICDSFKDNLGKEENIVKYINMFFQGIHGLLITDLDKSAKVNQPSIKAMKNLIINLLFFTGEQKDTIIESVLRAKGITDAISATDTTKVHAILKAIVQLMIYHLNTVSEVKYFEDNTGIISNGIKRKCDTITNGVSASGFTAATLPVVTVRLFDIDGVNEDAALLIMNIYNAICDVTGDNKGATWAVTTTTTTTLEELHISKESPALAFTINLAKRFHEFGNREYNTDYTNKLLDLNINANKIGADVKNYDATEMEVSSKLIIPNKKQHLISNLNNFIDSLNNITLKATPMENITEFENKTNISHVSFTLLRQSITDHCNGNTSIAEYLLNGILSFIINQSNNTVIINTINLNNTGTDGVIGDTASGNQASANAYIDLYNTIANISGEQLIKNKVLVAVVDPSVIGQHLNYAFDKEIITTESFKIIKSLNTRFNAMEGKFGSTTNTIKTMTLRVVPMSNEIQFPEVKNQATYLLQYIYDKYTDNKNTEKLLTECLKEHLDVKLADLTDAFNNNYKAHKNNKILPLLTSNFGTEEGNKIMDTLISVIDTAGKEMKDRRNTKYENVTEYQSTSEFILPSKVNPTTNLNLTTIVKNLFGTLNTRNKGVLDASLEKELPMLNNLQHLAIKLHEIFGDNPNIQGILSAKNKSDIIKAMSAKSKLLLEEYLKFVWKLLDNAPSANKTTVLNNGIVEFNDGADSSVASSSKQHTIFDSFISFYNKVSAIPLKTPVQATKDKAGDYTEVLDTIKTSQFSWLLGLVNPLLNGTFGAEKNTINSSSVVINDIHAPIMCLKGLHGFYNKKLAEIIKHANDVINVLKIDSNAAEVIKMFEGIRDVAKQCNFEKLYKINNKEKQETNQEFFERILQQFIAKMTLLSDKINKVIVDHKPDMKKYNNMNYHKAINDIQATYKIAGNDTDAIHYILEDIMANQDIVE